MAKNNMGLKTKSKILDAAHDLFNEKGFDHVSVEEIAKRSSITKAMIYYHFDSKEAIMLELVKNLLELIKEEINCNVLDISDQEMMQTHIGDMIRLWKSNKEIGLFIITTGIKDKNILSNMMEIAKSFYDQLVKNDKLNLQFKTEDKEYFEQYFKLLIFNTIPMVSLSILMDNLVTEFKIPEERLNEVFRDEFINILYRILKN